MKISYDPKHNIAYLALRERPAEVETIHISDEMNVDLAADGTIYGIELLNANDQLAGGVDGILSFVDESTGETSQIRLKS